MLQTTTMPDVESLMDRQRLVGWIVRDEIINSGISYSEASRRWPIALPTLNRLMNTGNVSLRFYRVAEINLGLPRGLLELVIDGRTDDIAKLPDLNEPLRTLILTEMGATPPPAPRRRRKA